VGDERLGRDSHTQLLCTNPPDGTSILQSTLVPLSGEGGGVGGAWGNREERLGERIAQPRSSSQEIQQ